MSSVSERSAAGRAYVTDLTDVKTWFQSQQLVKTVGVCGRRGRCQNLEERAGYICSCPVGITGQRCEQGMEFHHLISNTFNVREDGHQHNLSTAIGIMRLSQCSTNYELLSVLIIMYWYMFKVKPDVCKTILKRKLKSESPNSAIQPVE